MTSALDRLRARARAATRPAPEPRPPSVVHVGDCLAWLRTIPDASVDSIVTDPPYGLGKEPDPRAVLHAWLDGAEYQPGGRGFMGAEWDAFVPSPVVWAECYRVLKPGGHLLSFAGTRTYDWIALGVRLAGFEIRDQLAWLYGTGFPKSQSIGKAIDKARDRDADTARALLVTRWINGVIRDSGRTYADILDAFGFNPGSGQIGHWAAVSEAGQPAVPSLGQIAQLLPLVGSPSVPEDVASAMIDANEAKGQPGEAWFRRTLEGVHSNPFGMNTFAHSLGVSTPSRPGEIRGAPATPDAERWEGWGTALKPAQEPIVMARKPFKGATYRNVLEHGTGAIHVDACRVGTEQRHNPSASNGSVVGLGSAPRMTETEGRAATGRWPANVIHDGSAEVVGLFPGSAARFFYSAKASKSEREWGLDGLGDWTGTTDDGRAVAADNAYQRGKSQRRNIHPTVKPVALVGYLQRLITPPGGLTLDPYLGSGTAAMAAHWEGFRFRGCEMDTAHATIAQLRYQYATQNPCPYDRP